MGKLSQEEFDRQLMLLEQQFLCCKPIELINWMDILHPDNMSTPCQSKLINKTINSSEFEKMKMKTKISHRIRFLRHIINALEAHNVEIDDIVYESYTDLIQNKKSENLNESCKIYKIIPFETTICLPHSDEIIKNGTTGLYTWEASGALAEFALANIGNFRGKKILELGCGTGLCGFVIHRTCEPEMICLTDGNEMVYNQLVKTYKMNYDETNVGNIELTVYSIDFPNLQDIKVLDWNKIDESTLVNTFIPDIIIAADVIYDNTLFEPLSRTIQAFFDTTKNCTFYLACTIRNANTTNEFLSILDALKFERKEEHLIPPTNIYWSNSTTIKIFSFIK